MLRVHRKGYVRKAYRREDGKLVHASRVAPTNYLAKDKGKRGRTPKNKRWFESNKHTLGEYEVEDSAKERHSEIRKADRKIGTVKVHHHLLGLANVTANKKAEKVFRTDLKWVDRKLLNEKEGRRLVAKARKANLKGGKNPRGPG